MSDPDPRPDADCPADRGEPVKSTEVAEPTIPGTDHELKPPKPSGAPSDESQETRDEDHADA